MTKLLAAGSVLNPFVGASHRAGHCGRCSLVIRRSPDGAASRASSMRVGSARAHPNKRLKLSAHVDYGMNLSPVRRSLSAIR